MTRLGRVAEFRDDVCTGRRVATVIATRLLVAVVVFAAVILWVATGLQTANLVVGLVAMVGAIIGYVPA